MRLHRQITSRPNTQRLLESNSEELPAEILKLNALSVLADDDFLFIKMTPGGAGIVVYPDDSMKAHVQARPLGDSIYYYPTNRILRLTRNVEKQSIHSGHQH